ncbi:MAG: right-handed parallel beta-helix repeat-containing protein [Planctomycetota bacterium]|nr:right-handed parallel beta-helix repeat-containing protein [Planctomycetota bacterium]
MHQNIRLSARPVWIAAVIVITLTVISHAAAPRLYVATNGDDLWSGSLPAPNAARTDGPLKTLTAARDAVRGLRVGQGVAETATIQIRAGVYELTQIFTLDPADSNTVYEAYPNEKPILTGGREISGFQQAGPLWETTLPDVPDGKWYFRQLFANGARRQRARSPNTGYFRIAELIPGPMDPAAKRAVARDRFKFAAGDLQAFANLDDINLILMHSWENSIHPLKSIDTQSRTVQFAAPLKEWWTIGYWEERQRYCVENAREFLDQPGEWYLDRKTGVLSYWPMPGEQLNQTKIVAPFLKELVKLAGNPDSGQLVRNITLRGLTFHHADWNLDPKGNSSTQAAVEVPAAIMADGARNCIIEKCEVAHVGIYGLWLRRGCKDCTVRQTRLFDLGAGGIRVGEAQRAKTDEAESSTNTIDNNHIYDGGHVYPAGIGIWVAQSSYNAFTHNDVHDMLYSGMSIGWNWGDDPNRTHHNRIEFNHVHHLVKGAMSDAGAIYCLGVSTGSVIRNNLFHDVWPYSNPPFGWGIYLDAVCSGYLVENNVVYNTLSGGLMYNNGGYGHVIQNNIFALSGNYQLWPYWGKSPKTFRHNIVYMTQGDLFVPFASSSLKDRIAKKEPIGQWDENVIWHTALREKLPFFKWDLAGWRAMGLDTKSVLSDPMFVNGAEYDFALKEGSPALALGFKPIDVSKVGLYGDPAWVNEAKNVKFERTVLPAPPGPPPMVEMDDDFESTPLREKPKTATVDGEFAGASIRISDEHAATGKHSLKFTDTKDCQPSWQPHMFYRPHIRDGLVRQSFDLRMETNARFFTEWRDESDYPQNVGPSVAFGPQGQVSAAGRLLTTIPTGQWVHVEIEGPVGEKSAKAFELAITIDDKQQTFENLPYAGKSFRELQWLGFSSTAAEDSVFYLDNLKIKRLSK